MGININKLIITRFSLLKSLLFEKLNRNGFTNMGSRINQIINKIFIERSLLITKYMNDHFINLILYYLIDYNWIDLVI